MKAISKDTVRWDIPPSTPTISRETCQEALRLMDEWREPGKFREGQWVRARVNGEPQKLIREHGPEQWKALNLDGKIYWPYDAEFEPWVPRQGEWVECAGRKFICKDCRGETVTSTAGCGFELKSCTPCLPPSPPKKELEKCTPKVGDWVRSRQTSEIYKVVDVVWKITSNHYTLQPLAGVGLVLWFDTGDLEPWVPMPGEWFRGGGVRRTFSHMDNGQLVDIYGWHNVLQVCEPCLPPSPPTPPKDEPFQGEHWKRIQKGSVYIADICSALMALLSAVEELKAREGKS